MDNGASASRPGSREPSPDGLGPTGFDPSRGPVRTHDLILRVGADTAEDLAWSLRHLADDVQRAGLSAHCCSGSPSVGYMYSYRHNSAMTHDLYFQQIDEWLERDSDGSGEAGETETGSTEGDSAGRSDSEGIAR